MSREVLKVWISKYALTQGIYELEVDHDERFEEMVVNKRNNLETYHGNGVEWHLTKEDSIKRAEEMRLKKIESHKKAIAKLEKLKF